MQIPLETFLCRSMVREEKCFKQRFSIVKENGLAPFEASIQRSMAPDMMMSKSNVFLVIIQHRIIA